MPISTRLIHTLRAAAAVLSCGAAQADLLGRDIHGQAVGSTSAEAVFIYDTQFDVTWLRDMQARSLTFTQAAAYADTLQIGAWSDWSLPQAMDYSNLWKISLGNSSLVPVSTSQVGSLNQGPFLNFDPARGYWTIHTIAGGTEAMNFVPQPGINLPLPITSTQYAPVLRNGDVASTVSPVPEPGTYALMALGLAGLALRRRFQRD